MTEFQQTDDMYQHETGGLATDSYCGGGNEVTNCDIKPVDRCHWMLIDGVWWPDCDGESTWEVPPSGYCPNCGREVEVIEDEDVAESTTEQRRCG